jgi:multicomponent Na+:H+ antiporter subunit E
MVVWWILTEGDRGGLGFGVAVALVVSFYTVRAFAPPRHRIRLHRLPSFGLFFLVRSVLAGVDVARRLLRPTLPISPGRLVMRVTLPGGGPTWLLANTLSLLPGTVTSRLEGDELELHCLDLEGDVAASVRQAEAQVASLFGCGSGT